MEDKERGDDRMANLKELRGSSEQFAVERSTAGGPMRGNCLAISYRTLPWCRTSTLSMMPATAGTRSP